MRAYMRNQFEYLGVATPEHRAAVAPLIKQIFSGRPGRTAHGRGRLVAHAPTRIPICCDGLLGRYQAVLSLDDLPWLLELAQPKSWWDTVDSLVKTIGAVVRRAGTKGKRAMDAAVKHENFWVRRIAMLHQLGLRDEVDTDRLFRYAELLAAEKEFFIRKAIGWALSDYAWHDWRAIEKFLKTTQVRALRADGSRGEQEFCGALAARRGQAGLDAAAAQVVVCGYTGKEVDPAYEQRLFEL